MLSVVALLPVILSALIYLAERTKAIRKLPYAVRQLLIGVLFGGLAILGTEFGIKTDGAIINARDASPICAGLLFGAPAGIIAGLIGGVERWFAVLWGAGQYTRLACSISTVLAGVFAAVLRKFMFDNKKPKWYYCLATATITEVIHMLMIFLTNMTDARTAFSFVRTCSLPMIAVNSLAVMLAGLLLSILSGADRKSERRDLKKISQSFQRFLLICVTAGFLMTTIFTWALQTELAKNKANNLVKLNIEDVKADILDASNHNLLSLTAKIAERIHTADKVDYALLCALGNEYDVAEINIINPQGIIVETTYEKFRNYDMRGGHQSAEFLVLLDGETKEYVQNLSASSSNPAISRKYAGIVLDGGGFVQVAYDAERFQKDIDDVVIGVTRNRHIGENGSIIIAGKDWNIVSDRHGNEGKNLDVSGIYIDRPTMPKDKYFDAVVYGEKSLCRYIVSEGYYIVAAMPYTEAVFSRDVSVYVTVFMEFVVFGMLFIVVYFLIKKLVVDNMVKINQSLAKITSGNLDTVVNVRTNEEFASLSDDINSTVLTLKRYIAEAAARIDKELEFAKAIQHSAIPMVFPPYPGHSEFDIYATMDTAKEVGESTLRFLFCRRKQARISYRRCFRQRDSRRHVYDDGQNHHKRLCQGRQGRDEVFTVANAKLCESNEAGMFVTAWMGMLDITTGRVEFANAGHNPPLVRHADGSFEFLKSKPGFILAGMEGMKYRKNELVLSAGDEIYLYTDGVTEATNAKNELYGEKRLVKLLDSLHGLTSEGICRAVKADIDAFVGDAPQFDDITMLYLKYNGGSEK